MERAAADGITLDEVTRLLGPAGYCFLCLVLSVPFLQPFSLGPLTMVSGMAFIIIGWQMARGHATPRLPEKAGHHAIHGKGWVAVLKICRSILNFCRRFTRPRFVDWVSGSRGTRGVGWLVFSGGVLLAIPFANLPFNNTFPALMILCAVIGWLERDGLMAIIALVWGFVSILYFAAIAVVVWCFGRQILAWLNT